MNLINPKDNEELELALNGKKRKINLDDFAAFAPSLQIPEKAYLNALKKFQSKNGEVMALISPSFLTAKHKEQYMEIWNAKQRLFHH